MTFRWLLIDHMIDLLVCCRNVLTVTVAWPYELDFGLLIMTLLRILRITPLTNTPILFVLRLSVTQG